MEKFIESIAKKQKLESAEDFYAAIGYGGIFLSKIMPRIKDEYNKLVKVAKPEPVEIKPIRETSSSDGVIVDGMSDCLIRFSKCCAPLPGDEIIGFITRGHGVSIHKRDCNNVPVDIASSAEPGRWINASWSTTSRRTSFISTLRISGINRDGLLADVTVMLYNMHVSLHAVNARPTKPESWLPD